MIKISSKTKGAELTSIEFNNEEKLHNGIDFWQRQSPILFPIVGQLKNGETIIEGIAFFTTSVTVSEGSSSPTVFVSVEAIKIGAFKVFSESCVTTGEFWKKYPYNFELHVSYESSEDTVKTIYKVKN